jgi:predicted SnoaL-like aldol condensation-catalyzing enzyme
MDDTKAVMRKMVQMFATGDLAALDSVVSTNYVDHQGIDGRELRGREGFGDLVRAVHAPHGTALRVTIEDLIGDGDRAAARLRWHHTGEDGSVVERETIDIIRSTKGLAVEHWGAEVTRSDAG